MIPPFTLPYAQQPAYLIPSHSSMPLQYALVPQLVGLPTSQLGPYMQYPLYPFAHQTHYSQISTHPPSTPVDPLRSSSVRRSVTGSSSRT